MFRFLAPLPHNSPRCLCCFLLGSHSSLYPSPQLVLHLDHPTLNVCVKTLITNTQNLIIFLVMIFGGNGKYAYLIFARCLLHPSLLPLRSGCCRKFSQAVSPSLPISSVPNTFGFLMSDRKN